MAEADRLPEASARYYDTLFHTNAWPLFLSQRCQLAPAADIARELLGRTASPRLVRALFDVEELLNELPGEASIAADVDLVPIRRAVAALMPGL
jgi:hypothetical protein